MTKTARKIAGALAYRFIECAVNYEPIGARMVDECAVSLDDEFPGVHIAYLALTTYSREELYLIRKEMI